MNEPRNDAPREERAWEAGWQEHEALQRARLAKLTLTEKIAWLESAQRLVEQLRSSSQSAPKTSASRP